MKVSHTTRQWLMYFFALLVIVFGTILLVAFAQGYNIDWRSGQINANGLVLIDSSPGGASISLDGKAITNKTPYRYDNAPAGNLAIELNKSGYRRWSARQLVVSREVTFADYAMLIPVILDRQSIAEPVAFAKVTQSSNNTLSVGLDAASSALYSIAENGEARQIYSASATQAENPKVTGFEVAPDGGRVLITQKNDSGAVIQLLLQPGSTPLNLTGAYGTVFAELRFNPTNSSELFWLEKGNIRKLQTDSRSFATAQISNVASYSVSADRLIVVENNSAQTQLPPTVFSYNFSLGEQRKITTLTDRQNYTSLFIRSRYAEYLALLAADGTLTMIKNPYSTQQISSVIAQKSSHIMASPNSRFFAFVSAERLRTIDLEGNQHFRSAATLSKLGQLQWYNNYHLIGLSDNNLMMIDFDGQNLEVLSTNDKAVLFHRSAKSVLVQNQAGGIDSISLELK